MKPNQAEEKQNIWCPYCEDEGVKSKLPYCKPCELTHFHCLECKAVVPRENEICPECGARIKPEETQD